MTWLALADAVLVLHFAFILFAVFGGLLVLRHPRLAWLHLPAAAWAVLIEFGGWICPLTPLEVWLRRRGGAAGFEGGFIDHYLGALVYPDGLTRGTQVLLGVLLLAFNIAIYLRVWARRRAAAQR